jgi:DNA invertase Pin-like site-specific DNA recombinase
MSFSELMRPEQIARKAVVYIRQSTVHQVKANREGQRLQREMVGRALALGWPADRVDVVDADTGLSAATASGRKEYKHILAEVALGHVGIVISYESARVARNCTDWYALLDLGAARHCLIADRDGVYDPSTANGRLLLGMKGMLSEFELHTLRGRLIAGAQAKAARGELRLALPVGLVRLDDARVVHHPDRQVRGAIALAFKTFLERRSVNKVLTFLRRQGLSLPRRGPDQQIVWRIPTLAGILGLLRNPAYAGAYVYGRRPVERTHGVTGACIRQRRLDVAEWKVVLKDRYPPYMS